MARFWCGFWGGVYHGFLSLICARFSKAFCARFWIVLVCALFAEVCLSNEFDTNMRDFNLYDDSLAQTLKSPKKAQSKIKDSTKSMQDFTHANTQKDFTKDFAQDSIQDSAKTLAKDLAKDSADFAKKAPHYSQNQTTQNQTPQEVKTTQNFAQTPQDAQPTQAAQSQNPQSNSPQAPKNIPPNLPLSPASKTAAAEYDKDNQRIFELLADEVKSENNVIHAIHNAIMINPDLYTIADVIKYDIENKKVYAEGEVRIYRGGTLLVRTHSASFELDEHYGILEPLYLQDTTSGMWVNALSGSSKKGVYGFKKAIISGCQVQSPIWRMEASSGSYNAEKQRVSLWNPRVYIGDVPIFYFPYFTIDTNLNRKSGFLFPYFLSSNTEGFIYAQPYFVPIKSWFDMTFTPQVRTSRGAGGHFEMRLVDSSNDRTMAEVGYLYNFDSYRERYDIKNREVYGFRFYHLGKQPLQKYFRLKSELDNGIYVNMVHMNDLDYYRLDKANKRIYDATYASKANFYLQTDNHYFGLNIKYFLNLAKLSNSTTLQSVPNLQYHKYTNSLFWKSLLYSIDYQMKNTIRTRGYGYIENAVKIPIGLQFSLFKKYLSIGFWNEFYAENLNIHSAKNSYVGGVIIGESQSQNLPNQLKFGNIFSANYSLSLNTDLSRSFDKIFHAIQFEALFSGPYPYISYADGLFDREAGPYFASLRAKGLSNRNSAALKAEFANTYPFSVNGEWRYYDDIWDPSGISAYSILANTLDLKLSQYFITNNGNPIFDWKIFQRLNFDADSNGIIKHINDPRQIARRPLENRFTYSPLDGLSLSTSFFYSFYYGSLNEISASISYNVGSFSSLLSYYYKDGGANRGFDLTSNTFTTNTHAHYIRGVLSKDFGVFALSMQAGYDISRDAFLDWDIGVYKNVRCFGIGLKFINRRRPILTNNVDNPFFIQSDYFVRVVFNFVPLGGTGLSMRF